MKLNLKARLDRLVLNSFYIAFITLAILLLAEMAAGFYLLYNTPQPKFTNANSKAYSYFDWRDQYFADKKKPGGKFQYEPYSVWKHTDKQTDLINIRNGYRVSWEPVAAPGKKDFVIFMFGGSTTYGIESPDELTIASLLARKLNESSSEYRFLVRNFGVSAFVSDQEVHLLARLLGKGERPDAVIFYDGLNDIQIKAGLGRKHFFEDSFQKQLYVKMSMSRRLQRAADRSRIFALLTDRPSSLELLFPFITDREILRQNAESMLAEYRENMRIARALGESYGFRTLNFWQPSLFNTGKKLTPDEELRDSLSSDLYDANQLIHEIVAEAAADMEFFDRSAVIDIRHAFDDVNETIFVDSNHVTPIGNAAVADAMLGWVSRRLVP